MPISRASVLTGHVLANVLQTMFAVAIVVVVAVLIGFRATTSPVEWLGAAGLLAGYEATKSRHFCGSCHVMTPYSADSDDLHSTTLAARHAGQRTHPLCNWNCAYRPLSRRTNFPRRLCGHSREN